MIATLVVLLVLSYGCTQPQQEPIGGQKDSHGCLIAAGYSWCDALQKCYRPWEENCTNATATGQECTALSDCPPGSARCVNGTCTSLDEHGCVPDGGYTWCDASQKCIRPWEENCTAQMTEAQARAIAQASPCTLEGNLTPEAFYNNNSMTWWIGTDIQKPGCSPACVVYENGSAEINWRCTGLIPPEQSNGSVMPGSDRDSHGCIPSAGYSWCDSSQKCYRPWEENCSTQ